ncbi:MAG: 50S ribosomal protein L3 [Halofilum sp. (in: g-proteobacteria)]|nr:50S ribosomal protein L3 [Halofilum sp. (in: g-proteobacteria)]
MAIGVIGRKAGMTRVFTDEGASVPVTVIRVEPNRVTQIKSVERDGYAALQVTTGERRASRVTRAQAGHYAKAGTEPGRGLWEFRVEGDEAGEIEVGAELGIDRFEAGQRVDVRGTSKGRGFAGAVKRHNFRTQDASHGNSLAHRVPGSIGQAQDPGRVLKGKKMPGHMGNERKTTQNLEVVRVDTERGLILVKGAVPGAVDGDLVVLPSVKARR